MKEAGSWKLTGHVNPWRVITVIHRDEKTHHLTTLPVSASIDTLRVLFTASTISI